MGWNLLTKTLAVSIISSLVVTALGSPLFAYFIVEEGLQQGNFAMFVAFQMRNEEAIEDALKLQRSLLEEAEDIYFNPWPIVSLVRAYFLFLRAATGYFLLVNLYWKPWIENLKEREAGWREYVDLLREREARIRASEERWERAMRVCTSYSYEYKVLEFEMNYDPKKLEEVLQQEAKDGWSVKETYKRVDKGVWYLVVMLQRITVREWQVPLGEPCG